MSRFAREAEVDQAEAPVGQDEEVSRMRFRVEAPILENLGQYLSQREIGDLPRSI